MNVSDGFDKPRLSVVVPVYNNEPTVRATAERIIDTILKCSHQIELEIVFVDDGSRDESWRTIEAVRDDWNGTITAVRLSRNFGQISAILAGCTVVTGDAVVIISADLQDPPELIPKMLDLWQGGADIVIAHRVDRHDPIIAKIASKLAYACANAANPRMPAGGFDYLLLSRRSMRLLLSFRGRHRFFQGDVMWMGYQTAFIPYVRLSREKGRSEWTIAKKIKYFIDLILDSSYLPIRIMSALGGLTTATGLIYAMVIAAAWLRNETPFEAWAPLMVVMLLIGGVNMLMLGVLGEYLWRLYDDVRGKPLFVTDCLLMRQGWRPEQVADAFNSELRCKDGSS